MNAQERFLFLQLGTKKLRLNVHGYLLQMGEINVKHVNPFFEVIIFMQCSYGLLWKVEKI